jgi:hypothetical protein
VGIGVFVVVGNAVRVAVGSAVRVGVGISVRVGVAAVVLVGTGVEVLLGTAVLVGVRPGGDVFAGGWLSGRSIVAVAPVMGTAALVLVVVPVMVPATKSTGVATGEAVDEGATVTGGGNTGEFVGVKNRSAKASRVSARSMGVTVAVNLGVMTISGRVSSLSPDITNGI